MQEWGSTERIKAAICQSGMILSGFTVAEDHSEVLCVRGAEWYHSRRRPDQRKIASADRESKRHKR
jgi:hypothetical protein